MSYIHSEGTTGEVHKQTHSNENRLPGLHHCSSGITSATAHILMCAARQAIPANKFITFIKLDHITKE